MRAAQSSGPEAPPRFIPLKSKVLEKLSIPNLSQNHLHCTLTSLIKNACRSTQAGCPNVYALSASLVPILSNLFVGGTVSH
jgi:hypothetical protein